MEEAAVATQERSPTLFQQAANLFERSLEIRMDFHPALLNLNAAYIGLALICPPGRERFRYAEDAAKRSEEAVLLAPNSAHSWFSWGTATAMMGDNSEGTDAVTYFKLASERFEKGVLLGYRNIQSLTDWGIALMNVGYALKNEQGVRYYDRCIEVLSEAITLEPNNDHLHYNLGNALCQRVMLPCDNRCELLKLARNCMSRANELGDRKHMYHVSADKISQMMRQAGCPEP
jgi:tetratricopeptide (TPR) repeat protein